MVSLDQLTCTTRIDEKKLRPNSSAAFVTNHRVASKDFKPDNDRGVYTYGKIRIQTEHQVYEPGQLVKGNIQFEITEVPNTKASV